MPAPHRLSPGTDTTRGIGLALAAAALWGLVPVVTKGALAGFPPEMIGTLRLAAAALAFRMLGGGGPWISRNPWSWVAGIGLGADFLLYNYGIRSTPAGLAGLAVNVEVVSTLLLAAWLLGERITRRRAFGAAVTLAGVALALLAPVDAPDARGPGWSAGTLLIMAAGITWSVFAVAQRRAAGEPAASTFLVALLVASPVLLRPAAWHVTVDARATALLALLAGPCTAGVYALYLQAQRVVDVGILALVLCTVPLFAVGFAALLLGETASGHLVGGGALVTIGLGIATRSGQAPATA